MFLTKRMGGKSTFAQNELFLKRPDDFYYFSHSGIMSKTIRYNINQKNVSKKIRPAQKSELMGIISKNIILDDYEHMSEDFRKTFFEIKHRFENIYIFACDRDDNSHVFPVDQCDFGNLIKKLRKDLSEDKTENKFYTKYEKTFLENDVTTLPETKIFTLKNMFNVTHKEILIKQRLG